VDQTLISDQRNFRA